MKTLTDLPKVLFNKAFFTIIVLAIITEKANSIFLSLAPKQTECIYKEGIPEKGLVGKYYLSGENEINNSVSVLDSKDNTIWSNKGKKQSEFRISVDVAQVYKICFESLDTKYLTVTFDFYDDEHLNNVVSSQSITDMNQKVHEMRKKIDIIHHDLRNSAIRRKVHMDSKCFI